MSPQFGDPPDDSPSMRRKVLGGCVLLLLMAAGCAEEWPSMPDCRVREADRRVPVLFADRVDVLFVGEGFFFNATSPECGKVTPALSFTERAKPPSGVDLHLSCNQLECAPETP